MGERFIRKCELPQNLYAEGSPIIVMAGALLQDNNTGNVITQLKFQSVSQKNITGVKVFLKAFDMSGAELQGVDGYQYLDINVRNGEEFGSDKAIIMPDKVTRSVVISSITVVFSDGDMWSDCSDFKPLPEAESLYSKLKTTDLVDQYSIEIGTVAKYIPSEYSSLWMCTCGKWNGGNRCTDCDLSIESVFSAFDVDVLTERLNTRLEQEKAERERLAEERRIAEEKSRAEKERIAEENRIKLKKTKKLAIIITPIVCALVALVVLINNVIIPNNKYNNALALMNEGKYEEAIFAFEAMDGYKDSATKIEECETAILDGEYDNAVSLMNDQKYDEAIVAFGVLDGYKDSVSKIEECEIAILDDKYTQAVSLMEDNQYDKAKLLFEELDGYKDSKAKIDECNAIIVEAFYDKAVQLIEDGDYENSYLIFRKLLDYKDSQSYLSNFIVTYDTYTKTDSEGKVTTHKYIYDEVGNCLKEEHIDSNKESYSFEYSYDINRNVTKKIYTNRDNEVSTDEYIYDDEGRLIKEKSHLSSGTIAESTYIYTEEKNGNVIKEEIDDYDFTTHKITYDKNGNLLSDIDVSVMEFNSSYIDDYYMITKQEYTYDKKGNLATYDYSYSNRKETDKSSTKYISYDSLGRLLEKEYTNKDGETSTFVYTYDTYGDQVKIVCTDMYDKKAITESTYDEYGNCIKTVTTENGVKKTTEFQYSGIKVFYIPKV